MLAKIFLYYKKQPNRLSRRNLDGILHASHTVWPQAYFSSRNTSAKCLLWPGNTSARNNFGPILRPNTSAQRPNFQSPICRCCCMLHNSRLENQPWLKMLLYKDYTDDVNYQAMYFWNYVRWKDRFYFKEYDFFKK